MKKFEKNKKAGQKSCFGTDDPLKGIKPFSTLYLHSLTDEEANTLYNLIESQYRKSNRKAK